MPMAVNVFEMDMMPEDRIHTDGNLFFKISISKTTFINQFTPGA